MSLVPRCFATPGPAVEASDSRSVGSAAAAAVVSAGQQQRVAVARSLVFDPQVVLMDEPLGALDKNLRESMQYEIKHIHESIGVTVVYVTHDQTEALTMSNRIAVFNDGKVQQLSSPDELYEKPVNSFVAEFIGENNKFLGQVSDISGDKCKIKLEDGTEILANTVAVKAKGDALKPLFKKGAFEFFWA